MGENNALEKQLLLFGLMRKAGRIVIGDEPVTDAIRRGEVLCVCAASDAAENTVTRFRRFAQEEGIPFLQIAYDKEAFGGVFGRESVAVAGVTDLGFAARLLELDEAAAGTQAARDYRERADRQTQEQKRRKAAERKPKASGTAAQSEKKPEKPRQAKRENREGKVYGRAPKAQPHSIGDRRREDAERKAAREAAERTRDGTGGQTRSDRPHKPRNPGTRDGKAAYTENRTVRYTHTENAPRKSKRPGNPSAKRGNGGKA